ncbi:hypothetical protein SAMN02745866_00948 [Alteromonadaceae bacterium Bs31]|nr:hypothetical protein SAMN02745866_00948 [Alteromonadaceae bacterium Bs31]
MLFLQILGGIFLILLFVGAFYGWKILRFFRRLKGIANSDLNKLITVLPEMSLELENSDLVDWQERDKLVEQENTLRRLGLVHHGYFVTYAGASTVHISLWCFKKALVFAFYEGQADCDEDNPIPPTFCYECLARLSDGGSLCISNSSFADLMPRQSQHRLLKTDLVEPAAMLNTLKKNIPTGTKVLPIADVKKYFCETYEQINEWLWQEPQLRSAEIDGVMQQLGIEASDELITELLQHGKLMRSELRSKQIISRLSANAKMSAAKWEQIRDKLVVIHSDMTSSELVGAIYQLSPNINQKQEDMLDKLADDKTTVNGLEEFGRLCSEYGFARNAKRLAKVSEPVRGEIYLMP